MNNYGTGSYPQWQPQFGPWFSFPYHGASRGILGSRPSTPSYSGAHAAKHQYQPTTDFAEAFATMTLPDSSASNWFMDTGATTNLTSSPGIVHSVLNHNTNQSVIVGNGSTIPPIATSNSLLHSTSRPLHLNNILITPQIVKNLISVRQFTTDNWCSIEFDPFGFSVKDLHSRKPLLRSSSSRDLYPGPTSSPHSSSSPSHSVFAAFSSNLWHKRLGHTNNECLRSVISQNSLPCN